MGQEKEQKMNKRLTKDEFPTENDKSCPFCASREIVCEQTDVGEGWIVWCRNCGAFGPNDLGWSGAIEMWNMRRPMNEVMGAVKGLFVSYEKMRHNQDLNHLATDMVNLTTSVSALAALVKTYEEGRL
jgi:hypothetical protein